MKRKVVVDYGEQKTIANLMHCTPEMVSHSLSFRKNSKLARSIRKLAIERGRYRSRWRTSNTKPP